MAVIDWSGWASGILNCTEDTTTPTGSVVCFLQSNLGILNAKIGTSFYTSGDLTSSGQHILPTGLNNIESGIMTEMYICNTYRKAAMKNIGAAGCEVLQIEDPDGGKIKIASKTNAAHAARGLYKDCCNCLDDLIKWYKQNSTIIQPKQVLLNARLDNDAAIRCINVTPPDGYYSQSNYILN